MMLTTRLWLFVTVACGILLHTSAQCVQNGNNRTHIRVEYEYKLEVNSTEGNGNNIDAAFDELQSQLESIDEEVVPHLREQLSYEEGPTRQMPSVKVNRIESEIINQCFTESDACSWIRSTVFLSHAKNKPEYSVERVTLNLVKDYLAEFSTNTASVHTAYTYPMLVSGSGRFEMTPVSRRMNESEIAIFEDSFYDVFASVIFSFDGDTEVTDAQFIYQDLNDAANSSQAVTVDVKYFGRCRHCDDTQFVAVVDGVIQASMMLDTFKNLLVYNGAYEGTDYFDSIESVTYSERYMPSDTPEVSDEAIYDSEAPSSSSGQPWFLYFGIVMATLIVLAGIILICQDQKELKELMKADVSTDEDDSLSTRDDEEGGSSQSHSSRSDYDDEEYTREEYTEGEGESRQPHSNGTGAEQSTVIQEENPMSPTSGQQKNEYEIYVY